MTFDGLWEQEELQGLHRRLKREFPTWRRRRNRRRSVVATLAVLVATGAILFSLRPSMPKGYDAVCCNRSGIADSHWAEVAANILTIETL